MKKIKLTGVKSLPKEGNTGDSARRQTPQVVEPPVRPGSPPLRPGSPPVRPGSPPVRPGSSSPPVTTTESEEDTRTHSSPSQSPSLSPHRDAASPTATASPRTVSKRSSTKQKASSSTDILVQVRPRKTTATSLSGSFGSIAPLSPERSSSATSSSSGPIPAPRYLGSPERSSSATSSSSGPIPAPRYLGGSVLLQSAALGAAGRLECVAIEMVGTSVVLYDLSSAQIVARHTVEGTRISHACNSGGHVACLYISAGPVRQVMIQVFQNERKSAPRPVLSLGTASEPSERTGFVFISEGDATASPLVVVVGYRHFVWAFDVDRQGAVGLHDVLLDRSHVSNAHIVAMQWHWDMGGLVGLSDGTLLRLDPLEAPRAELVLEMAVSAVAMSPSSQSLWCVLADGSLLLKRERAPWSWLQHLGQPALRFERLGTQLFAVCGFGLAHLVESSAAVSYLCVPGGVAGLWLGEAPNTLVAASQLGKLTTWNWLTGDRRTWSAKFLPPRCLHAGVHEGRFFVLLPSGALEMGPSVEVAPSPDLVRAAVLCQRLVRGRHMRCVNGRRAYIPDSLFIRCVLLRPAAAVVRRCSECRCLIAG
jgi:hypothetical protein